MPKPIIWTSCWGTPLPDGYLRVGISRGVPRGTPAGYRRYPRLAPNAWFNSVTPLEYQRLYADEVLARLDPERVVEDLVRLAGDMVPVLVCFERPDSPPADWCHRAIVSV